MIGRKTMTEILVVREGNHVERADAGPTRPIAEYAWPVTVTCGCGVTEDLRVLTDDVCSRAAALHAIDDYLIENGWIPRTHDGGVWDGLETCADCRAAAQKIRAQADRVRASAPGAITKQVNALTAPGDPPKSTPPSTAEILDQLNRMTASPDSDQGYGTGETSIISKSNLPDLATDADGNGSAATVPDDVETDPLAAEDESDEWECEICHVVNSPDDNLEQTTPEICRKCGNIREPVGLDRPIDQ